MALSAQLLPLSIIDEPREAMRTEIPRDAIFELAQDIKRNGLISPITVRPVGDRYEVVAGHRRLLAHRYSGMVSIMAIVRDLSDDEVVAIMTSENLARENVNVVDEAIHTRRLYDSYHGDLGRTIQTLGRGRDWVQSRLLIADMPDELRAALRAEKIKIGVAIALSDITDDHDRATCLSMAISQGASVVVAQYWVAQWRAGLFGSAANAAGQNPNAPEAPSSVVMLRCAIDGREHPAADCVSMIVARENVGYIAAIREHLGSRPPDALPSPTADDTPPHPATDSHEGLGDLSPGGAR